MSKQPEEVKQFSEPKEIDNVNDMGEEEEKRKKEKKEIQKKALKIMKTEDPVDYIIKAFNKLHTGDTDVAKILLVSIGCQSVINSEGIQPSIIGTSRFGKTHCCESMLHLLPKKYIFGGKRESSSLSAKSLYYSRDIKSGSIIYCDDIELSNPLEGTIKRSTGIGYLKGTTHRPVIGGRQVEKSIPPRITWWLTSVDASKNEQLLNRQFIVKVDESKDHVQDVIKFGSERDEQGKINFPSTRRVKICREIIRNIKENELFQVIIPFATKIKYAYISNPSDPIMFRDAIKAFAVIRFKQREFDEDRKLIATEQDFRDAEELFNEQMIEKTFIDLNEKQREAWDTIYRWSQRYNNNPISRESLQNEMKYKTVNGVKKLLDTMHKKRGLLGTNNTDIIKESRISPSHGGNPQYRYFTTYRPGKYNRRWVSMNE